MRKTLIALAVVVLYAGSAQATDGQGWGYEWVSGGCWGATWYTPTNRTLSGRTMAGGYVRYERNDYVFMCMPM